MIADLQHLLHVVLMSTITCLSAKASMRSHVPSAARQAQPSVVEEHHAPAPTDGPSDRDALALAPGEILNALPNRDRSANPDLIEDRASARAHRLLVEPPEAPKRRPGRTDLAVEVEVLHDIAMHDQ
jgi:hypothetical protein